MTASTAFSTFGTLVKYGDGASPEVFTTVSELKDITPPDFSVEDIEVTHQASTDGYQEYIPGLVDGGEVSFDLNFVPGTASHTAMLTKLGSAACNWRIVYPAAVNYRWAFKAYVKAVSTKAPLSGTSEGSVTLKVTGKPVLEAGSS